MTNGVSIKNVDFLTAKTPIMPEIPRINKTFAMLLPIIFPIAIPAVPL